MKKEKGFSLIELLIVVASILIIAAIAIPNLIDNVLATATTAATAKSGYYSTYAPGAVAGTAFTVQAPPATPGTTGQRFFFTDQTGVIRYGLNSQPDPTSSPL